MFDAVIFDMDGLLMDSERLGVDVILACGRDMGADIPEDIVLETLGQTFAYSVPLYETACPGLDVPAMFRLFAERMHALARQGRIPLKPGVREILDTLDELGVPRAVASSSGPETIRAYLEGAGILGRFHQLVSGRDCARSKPFPDIFLLAAERLGADPSRCLVLEDSPSGVRAGRNAGMTVYMIPDMIPFDESLRSCCDLVLPDLARAAERLRHG